MTDVLEMANCLELTDPLKKRAPAPSFLGAKKELKMPTKTVFPSVTLSLALMVSGPARSLPFSPSSNAGPREVATSTEDITTLTSKKIIEGDLAVTCEMAKAIRQLAQKAPFQKDKAQLTQRWVSLQEAALLSPEMKRTLHSTGTVEPQERYKLWTASAKALGFDWSCADLQKVL